MIDIELKGSARLKKTSLPDQAAKALRRLILRNELPGGSVITEREICEYLGISRTPVREAVRTLVSEGLFVVSDKGRIMVANPDIDTTINLVGILGALEGLASELAAENATDEELATIRGHCDMMKSLAFDDGEFRYFDTNIAFHRTIVAASKNQQLVQMHKIVDDQLYQARYRSSRDLSRRQRAIQEHEKIIAALATRDGASARRAMTAHLKTTIRNLHGLEKEEQAG